VKLHQRAALPIAAAFGCSSFLASGPPLEDAAHASAAQEGHVCEPQGTLTVVLVVLDGVRWQEIFGGVDERLRGSLPMRGAAELVPNLTALAARGVALGAPGHGAPFLATGPNFVSLPGYVEVLTGRAAPCQENDCTDRPSWTLVDAFAARSDRGVAALSSWGTLARVASAGPTEAFVSTGRTGGETREHMRGDPPLWDLVREGEQANPAPGWGDYRPDAHTAKLALEYLAREKPAFAFVSLGDTDEHAHHGNYHGYIDALVAADTFVGEVMKLGDAWDDEHHEAVVMVTTDHGRSHDFRHHGARYPESSQSWLIAAGGPVAVAGAVASPEPRFLRDVAPTIAAISGVAVERREGSGRVLTEAIPSCTRAD
jgi:hypothetical protein